MEKTSPINNESPQNVGEGSDVRRGSPEEEYILKWTDHKVNFFSLAAADLFNDEDLTDVTICCGEKLFDAHKLILSVCSPYFKSMLTHKKKLNKFAMSSSASSSSNETTSSPSMNCSHHLNQMHPIIFLKDVSPNDFERLLQFMYYGEVRVPNDDLESLILTAKSLKVKGLSASSLPSSLSQPIHTTNSNKEHIDENQIEDLSTKPNPKSTPTPKHKETVTTKHNNHTPPKKRRISASALHAITTTNNHQDENDKEQGDENVEHPPTLKTSTNNHHHSHHPLSSTHHELQQRSTHFLSSSTERFLQNRDHPHHHHKLRSSISAAAFINELANDRILQRRMSPTPLNTSMSTVSTTSPSTTRPMTANSFVSSIRRQPLTPPPNNGGNVGICRGNPLDRRERLTPIRHSSGHQICSLTSRSSSKNASDSKQPPSSGNKMLLEFTMKSWIHKNWVGIYFYQ